METSLLITCFEPFAGRSSNMSMRLLGQLLTTPPPGIVSKVLPVDFSALKRTIPRLVRTMRPRRWLLLGEDANGERMRCERVAVNTLDSAIADNRGARATGRVVRGGPAAYFATLDPAHLVRHFDSFGIPARLSDDAGTYACNLALYLALHHSRRNETSTEVGFIHVPRSYQRLGHSLHAIRRSLAELARDLAEEDYKAA